MVIMALVLVNTRCVLAGKDLGDPSLLWGTYRPGYYFGLRTRLPDSPIFGLMWYNPSKMSSPADIRHSCSNSGGIMNWSYTIHDGRTLAVQHLNDTQHQMELVTKFIKDPFPNGTNGGHWTADITATRLPDGTSEMGRLLFYMGHTSTQTFTPGTTNDPWKARLDGETKDLGKFSLFFYTDVPDGGSLSNLRSIHIPQGHEWSIENYLALYFSQFWAAQMSRPEKTGLSLFQNDSGGNMYLIQLDIWKRANLRVVYVSERDSGGMILENLARQLVNRIDERIDQSTRVFNERFNRLFGSVKRFGPLAVKMGRETLSNVLGNIGYFYGDFMIDPNDENLDRTDLDDSYLEPYLTQRNYSLFTGTPSRIVFPRGFFFDEGFHQMLIKSWDEKLSMEMISSWLAQINHEGWVAREQILGPEPRTRVPQEFIPQHSKIANPPTLYLPLLGLIRKFRSDASQGQDLTNQRRFMTHAFMAFERHFEWLRRTQKLRRGVRFDYELFQWRGRKNIHLLASGK